jgi:hypothetical protein
MLKQSGIYLTAIAVGGLTGMTILLGLNPESAIQIRKYRYRSSPIQIMSQKAGIYESLCNLTNILAGIYLLMSIYSKKVANCANYS